jgi:hypothetical protein
LTPVTTVIAPASSLAQEEEGRETNPRKLWEVER